MVAEKRRAGILIGIFIVLVAVAAYVYLGNREDTSLPVNPSGIYYTGPMKSKSGPTYGTADGRPSTKEEAEAEAAKFFKEHPELNPGGNAPQ
jgi:hypothetical protein